MRFSVALFALTIMTWLADVGNARADTKDKRPSILVLLADNWAWPHASALGDKVVKTPTFDRLAREGVLFTHAFCNNPSCTPARAALLTGQVTHRLEDSGNLWSTLPARLATYPARLRRAGYVLGLVGKGWGPGNWQAGGHELNPAGPDFKSFAEFLQQVPPDRPFCFWYGHRNPHRSYVKGSGEQAGLKPGEVLVPPYLPDTPEVRSDITDYYLAVQKFDQDMGDALKLLEASGQADNTLIVIAGDNGWQFPRGLANVYDAGTRVPLAIRWPARVRGGWTADAFVDFTDLAPTFLEAAGVPVPAEMTGRSLVGLLTGKPAAGRDAVFLERERHANVRKGDLSYPCRAIRTRDFLYIGNFRPDLWPAGDPELHFAVGPFGDVDASPTKELILNRRAEPAFAKYFQLGFAKRPAVELYDLRADPWQVRNVAGQLNMKATEKELRARLDAWMKATADPRWQNADDDRWDRYRYYGPAKKLQ